MEQGDSEYRIQVLERRILRLRSILADALSNKNAYDDGFCRWCWMLGGNHHRGCWVERAEAVMKDTVL